MSGQYLQLPLHPVSRDIRELQRRHTRAQVLARYGQEARAQAEGGVLGSHSRPPPDSPAALRPEGTRSAGCQAHPSHWAAPLHGGGCLTGSCMALTVGAAAARGRQESGLGCRGRRAGAAVEQHRAMPRSLQPPGPAHSPAGPGSPARPRLLASACTEKPEASLLLAPHAERRSKGTRRREQDRDAHVYGERAGR